MKLKEIGQLLIDFDTEYEEQKKELIDKIDQLEVQLGEAHYRIDSLKRIIRNTLNELENI